MNQQHANASLTLQGASSLPPGQRDPIVQHLQNAGLPATRESYLRVAGLSEPLDAETEASLPPELRSNLET